MYGILLFCHSSRSNTTITRRNTTLVVFAFDKCWNWFCFFFVSVCWFMCGYNVKQTNICCICMHVYVKTWYEQHHHCLEAYHVSCTSVCVSTFCDGNFDCFRCVFYCVFVIVPGEAPPRKYFFLFSYNLFTINIFMFCVWKSSRRSTAITRNGTTFARR